MHSGEEFQRQLLQVRFPCLGEREKERALEPDCVFVAFALFTNVQVEHSEGGRKVLLPARAPQ